MYWHTHFTA